MAARPSSPRDDVLGSTPGPGEYHVDADADAEEAAFGSGGVRRRGRSPSRRKGATFGARPAHGGALSHLGESASKPGPGQYHDMHFPSAARDRGPAFTIREKLASREDLDSAPSDAPGPGEYYGEYREDDLAVLAGERRGVTIAGRTPAAGGRGLLRECVPRARVLRGPLDARGPRARARDFVPAADGVGARRAGRPAGRRRAQRGRARAGVLRARGVPVPDQGRAGGDRRPGGEFLWAPKGYTFGWHGAFGEQARDPRADALDAADVSPGPGEYHPDAADDGVYGFAGRGETPWRPAPGVTIGRRARGPPCAARGRAPGRVSTTARRTNPWAPPARAGHGAARVSRTGGPGRRARGGRRARTCPRPRTTTRGARRAAAH